jgi:hypothetical protein
MCQDHIFTRTPYSLRDKGIFQPLAAQQTATRRHSWRQRKRQRTGNGRNHILATGLISNWWTMICENKKANESTE